MKAKARILDIDGTLGIQAAAAAGVESEMD